ncbi:MAG: VOC family protein [Dehalococcoidia bacterium]|uniref:VOC family protein n=1 Tax=Candidatus Amarobacter glycogenicus TaxID=3140699 RepID=UPI002A17B54A|nr:VOC family protein [Dehalococcoidia bacterium]MBK7124478.1 VOC family protein [Dehalococcoidia bacterium]MBK9544448.1 VOC family protein [Dehalococcoidia bacterium]MBK9610391.1 VOC family protein [Dehalococcoidia bacterium]
MSMDSTVRVRLIVKDVPASVAFYAGHFGFSPEGPQSPAFSAVRNGNLLLLLSGAESSAARPMPDGRVPEPGGWTRFQVIVDDIEAEAAKLRAAGITFRNEIIRGPGGAQTVLDDPSGNPVELFQPAG